MPEHLRNAFKSFINKYDWELCQKLDDYYKIGLTEYVYNGYLPFIIRFKRKDALNDETFLRESLSFHIDDFRAVRLESV